MKESQPLKEPSESSTKVTSHFVRHRNAMLTVADFSEMYVDSYLHLADTGVRLEPEPDRLLKEALAALVLHLGSRPWSEGTAWTVHFTDPFVNVFATGDNRSATVIAKAFTEDVRELPENLFYSQVVRDREKPRLSAVPFTGADFFRAVEEFYVRSEQRPARYFSIGDERHALLTAQPDCDMEWFNAVGDGDVKGLSATEELGFLEDRHYRFECGCNESRMFNTIRPLAVPGPDQLFMGEDTLRVTCPRCGRRYLVTRESFEAHLEQEQGSQPAP